MNQSIIANLHSKEPKSALPSVMGPLTAVTDDTCNVKRERKRKRTPPEKLFHSETLAWCSCLVRSCELISAKKIIRDRKDKAEVMTGGQVLPPGFNKLLSCVHPSHCTLHSPLRGNLTP